MANPDTVMTPEFRVSFAHVFQAQKAQEAGKKDRYGLTALFDFGMDDPRMAPMKNAAQAAAVEFFGDKLKDPNFAKRLRTPFRDQGEKTDLDGYVSGRVFFNCTSVQRPGLVDANVTPIINESEFYSGCYARATIRFFGYDQKGNVGVGVGLNNVQKLRDGEPLGGRSRPEDDFQPAPAAAGAAGGGSGAALFS
jgi:hypothetical protein